MSTNLEYRAGERQKAQREKGDRDLEREIKNKGDTFFAGRIT